ncbi:MAG: hypothetical protein AB7O59_18705 [Pirellulales bacterium]
MSDHPLFRRFVSFCVPFLLVMVVDGGLTLAGQSAEYWSGSYDRVREWSLTFNDLLRFHPAALVGGLLVEGALLSTLILLLPRPLAMFTGLTVTLGHTWGAMTWLMYSFRSNYAQCQLFICGVALVLTVCLSKGWSPGADRQLLADRPVSRWVLIVVLAAIPTYLFLLRPSATP